MRPGSRPVKAFESHVSVVDEEGAALRKGAVRVNGPMKIGRYTFHQLSYYPGTPAVSLLKVTHDPGVPLVFLGFILLPTGVAFTLYVKPLLNRKAREDV